MAHDIGILFLHGFTGSRAELEWLQAEARAAGYRTRLPLLCGHESDPAALLRCRYNDWLKQAETEFRQLQSHCKRAFVAGLSMGGALALHIAASFHVAGVITMSAPIKLSRRLEWGARYLHRLFPWHNKKGGPDIRDRTARQQLRSYHRYPTRAALELFALLRLVRPELSRIHAPLLVLHSQQDHTVPVANAQYILQHVPAVEKRLRLLAESYHIISCDIEKELVRDEIFDFIKKHK